MSATWPAYLELHRTGELGRRVDAAVAELERCVVCPRECAVDRLADEAKLCRIGRRAKVATFYPHMGEEDCLRGARGSGTLFFSECNLLCVFCQNWDISREGRGREVEPRDLASMMIELQRSGCHNINLVSPEHVVPQVLEGLILAVERGLRLPLVYNTSAYDSARSLELLDGIVDVYMPDLKTLDRGTAARLLGAKDYPEVATAAIREMHRQVGSLALDAEGIARRGLLVRHLVMPGLARETREVLEWIARELSPDTYVNVMDQYYPAGRVAREPARYLGLNRLLSREEHRAALRCAAEVGLTRLEGHPAGAAIEADSRRRPR